MALQNIVTARFVFGAEAPPQPVAFVRKSGEFNPASTSVETSAGPKNLVKKVFKNGEWVEVK